MTLADFLLARIGEDEADAQVALGPSPFWFAGDEWSSVLGSDREGCADAHIIRWRPDRVLAECEAKRRIVELHAPEQIGWGPDVIGCRNCHVEMGETWGPDLLTGPLYPCETIELLALPYASHPDYREDWRATEA
jgi:hypothetical protein